MYFKNLLPRVKNVAILAIAMAFLPPFQNVFSQQLESKTIAAMVESYKRDPKGPYKDIRWFCKDGTTRPPQERCPEPGLQRARYKDEVISLGRTNHVFLGQILATTDPADFLDEAMAYSRMKQYMLASYLVRTDDGWILRKAQFYRGAIQAEDEENWGLEFFRWALSDTRSLVQHYFLIREAARDIPHHGDDSKTQKIRALSKEISDSVPGFMNIRVKIHGYPEADDLGSVKKFRESNRGKLSQSQAERMDELIRVMEQYYRAPDASVLLRYAKDLGESSSLKSKVRALAAHYGELAPKERITGLAGLLEEARREIITDQSPRQRLNILDISLAAEDLLFREIKIWEVRTTEDLLGKIYVLGQAAAGAGYLETWEWEYIRESLAVPPTQSVTLQELNDHFLVTRRMVEWGAGMFRGIFKDVVDLYAGFEPGVSGFIDDRVRSTLLLPLGDCTADLGEFIGTEANLSNRIMDMAGQSQARGLNPGVAMGELVVLNELTGDMPVSAEKIYVFNHPPADLKPVAGIATVSEGNMVSHVQLLARNLGIPNAVIPSGILEQLRHYQGQKVFYAVSNKGTVSMKPAGQMSAEEQKLFEKKERSDEKITVPADRLALDRRSIVSLRDVGTGHSGVICGPKAANLGRLKQLFPDHVVDGMVIPFGIFRAHMDQPMPGQESSYWEFLTSAFARAEEMTLQGKGEQEIEAAVLADLQILREAIRSMPLLPTFEEELDRSFQDILGKPAGSVPVFLRSDTNMEDLKDFTGAGLNLTRFNVVERDKVIQGIKEVWASPYAERSYKWRQRYLLNPLNVFPSILIIPTVNVDRSGVMITKGIVSGDDEDLTVAFSRGAGGAVEGQAAESWLLKSDGGNILLSPAREPEYNTLPADGGTRKIQSTFEKPILTDGHLVTLREMAERIKDQMVEKNQGQSAAAWDIELGFTGSKVWLFQIRPFVENKNAARLNYLKSISPELPRDRTVYMKSIIREP